MASDSHPVTTSETSPRRPVIARLRKRGWLSCGIIALIVFVLVPVFLCGLSLVIYIIFPPPPLDVLVMGLDSRPSDGNFARSDSIMVVGITPARLQASLLSIPRDLFIDVPGYGSQRINTINFLGEKEQPGHGPELLAQSIGQDFGIQIDRYVRLKFDGFVALIDAVGGVNIYVERVIEDYAYPTEDGGTKEIRFESGWQTMDGARALIYSRTRHGSDDYDRARRQQQVFSALTAKLRNPTYWPALLNVLGNAMDTNLTAWDLLTIAPPLLLNQGRYDQLVIDRDYILGTAQGNAVPNFDKLLPWIESRFN